jgi:UDP-N-acetylglucosamine:LPS N-acetylglucosamine transferase
LFKEVISKHGIDRDKIHVLGSARYCSEWMEQNRKILQRRMNAEHTNSKNLKVVFMTTRPQYRINIERMVKTFDLLSDFDGIEAAIKPHTRTGSEAKIYERVPLSDVSELSSVELCEWADVVIVIASSIIIEALTQNKPALYLKYLHENATEYEELGACWVINDDNELRDALLSLQNNKKKVPYNGKDVDRFLSSIVYGGQNGRDVLKDYEDFIVNSAVNCN